MKKCQISLDKVNLNNLDGINFEDEEEDDDEEEQYR